MNSFIKSNSRLLTLILLIVVGVPSALSIGRQLGAPDQTISVGQIWHMRSSDDNGPFTRGDYDIYVVKNARGVVYSAGPRDLSGGRVTTDSEDDLRHFYQLKEDDVTSKQWDFRVKSGLTIGDNKGD